MSDTLELGLLLGHPEHDDGPGPADALQERQAEEVRRREERRRERLRHKGTKGDVSHRTKYATAYYEKQDDILEALSELGMKKMPGNAVAVTWFIENVPTMYCDYELSRLKEEATNQTWTANDVRDIEALCAATVYADVVVPRSRGPRCSTVNSRTGTGPRSSTTSRSYSRRGRASASHVGTGRGSRPLPTGRHQDGALASC